MVKIYRDEPEFAGGPTTATVPEEVLNEVLSLGWKVAEKAEPKPVEKTEPKAEVKEEPKEIKEDKPKTAKKKLD